MRERLRQARLVATALLGVVLFNFPFLGVFDSDALVLGVPLLVAYLFGVWALLIALVAWIVRS